MYLQMVMVSDDIRGVRIYGTRDLTFLIYVTQLRCFWPVLTFA